MSFGINQLFHKFIRISAWTSFFFVALLTQVVASNRPADAVCVNTPSGLVSWWTGDGHARDTRNTNHSTFMNGATYASGEVSSAPTFNGLNQYLSIPQAAVLPVRGTGDFTIESWVNHQGDAGNEMFNVFAYRNGGQDIQFFITRTQIGIWGTSAAGMIILTPHNVNAATWNHFAFTRSGNTWRVFVNGSQVGGDAVSSVSLLSPTTVQAIGTTGLANTQFAKGAIDEISIYDRALNLPEIQSIYVSGTAGKCHNGVAAPIGLISSWSAEGNAVDPRSRNNGTPQNGAGYSNGLVGQTFSFNGSNQYVEIPDAPSLRPTAGITLEGWFKFNATTPNSALISKPFASGASNAYVLWIQGGSLWGSSGGGFLSTPFSPTTNRWYFIAYTYDAATFQHKLWLDGDVVSTTTQNVTLTYDSAPVLIGIDKDNDSPVLPLNGLADEVSIYNRALSTGEIQAICNAGSAGKIKPDATSVPFGLVGWWGGDGDARDYSDLANSGTLLGSGAYTVGKSGQSFAFNGALNSGVMIPYASSYDVNSVTGFTTEFWMKSNSVHSGLASLVDKSHGFSDPTGWVFSVGGGVARFAMGDQSIFSVPEVISSAVVDDGNYHHISGTWSSGTMSIYVDGVFQNSIILPLPYNNTRPLLLGHAWGGGTPERFFNGQIDEVSIYSRSLSATEIQSVFSAGLAGKLKSAVTPANSFTKRRGIVNRIGTGIPGIQLGDATVTLPVVSVGGETQQIPINILQLPPLPMGYTPAHLNYDIATSAVWTGTPTVCFNVPSLAAQFSNLRILHLENGNWVDRTASGGISPNLCTSGLSTLSPFVIANLIPTAASATISGRTLTADLRPIRNVTLQISGGNLTEPRFSRTNSFGYYRFEELEVGQIYVVSVSSRRFAFTNPTRLISLNDNLDGEDFVSADR